MKNELTATVETTIKAPAAKVWDALTKPEQIKQYLFGTDTETDWKVGHPIRFKGAYNGKSYEDKGIIQAFEPNKLLSYTYWSSMSGKEDIPENYMTVSFHLTETDGATKLSLEQSNVDTPESKKHSEENWTMVLKKLKELLEGKPGTDPK